MLTDDGARTRPAVPVRRVLSALTVLEIDGYARRERPAQAIVRTVRLHSDTKEGT